MRHFTALKLDALQSLKDKKSQDTAICPEILKNQAKIMEEMSVLYVGNISEDVTEDILAKVFGRFGKLTQIRLMLPKRDDKHICSFIKFSHFQGAYLAKQYLNERKLYGQNLKVVWSSNLAHQAKLLNCLTSYKGVQDS